MGGAHRVDRTLAICLEGRADVDEKQDTSRGRGQGRSWTVNAMLAGRLSLTMASILIQRLTFSHQALLSAVLSRLGRLGFGFTELGASKDFELASLMLRISIGCQSPNALNRSGSKKQKVSFLCRVWKQMVQHRGPPGKAPVAKTTSWFNVGAGGEVMFPYPCWQGGSKAGKKSTPPFPRRDFPHCTCHSCLSSIFQNLVTWPHLATGDGGKCSVYQTTVFSAF